jgi:hypothetical protein
MNRYLTATGNNSKKAMTLYRENLRLSQELFTIISCFEIALRNSINQHYTDHFGASWLRQSVAPGGMFLINPKCRITVSTVADAIMKLGANYTHFKLVAELGFGFWRYMFAPHQYQAAGQTLLAIFPARPQSGPGIQYNARFVFNQLIRVNNIRNRIAHHEPICFLPGQPVKDTGYVRQHYSLIRQMFNWIGIDEASLLYGLDHINCVSDKIDSL